MGQTTGKGGLDLLMILTLILALGTIVQDFRFDSSLEHERLAAGAIDRDLGGLQLAVSDLQAAQTGYLASGQGPDFWMTRASNLASQLDAGITRLSGTAANPESQPQYDAAAAALTDLVNIDKKARDDIKSDQRLVASDLVFMDGMAAAQRLSAALGSIRDTEARAAAGRITRLSQLRFGMNAVMMLFVLAVAFRATRLAARVPVPEPVSTAQMLRDLPPPVKTAPVTTPGSAARVTAPASVVNLPTAAELCVDLARVLDSRDVPALLERAAGILDAKGVILWVANSDGSFLRPSVTFGYPDKVLTRLGPLAVDGDNVTALAYRSIKPQSMSGTAPGSAGALAVPLVTATGCVGVLAAEIRSSRPALEVVAVARIIAAQFATIVGPDAESAQAAQA